jgi:mannose-6-phosphate isomerase-like protein (cupin superfamily)
MHKRPSRRAFLQAAPLVAASLALAEPSALALKASAAATPPATAPVPFQLLTADQIADANKQLAAKPGNDNLFDNPALPFTVVLTVEQAKAAKEFEWHEGRDHVLQVLDGTTVYEIGGKPQTPHSTKPNEWLAPTSEGATKLTLKKGDLLVIPRGTPHKRTTEGSVTFYLISTTGK